MKKLRDPAKHRANNKKWAKRHPDRVRNQNLKTCYGIGLKEFNEMLKLQDNHCAVCMSVDSGPGRKNPEKREPLFVDHDHVTGKIRGLLCRTHNTALGLLQDDLEVLTKMAAYISKSRL